jgi:hypothetical protein
MSRDAYGRTFPINISFAEKELANRDKIQAFEKLSEQGFRALERAIGDIRNSENATNSVLAGQPLLINSLGRAIGPMSDIIPPLAGVDGSEVLAARTKDMTYNVIPHPDQAVRLEVGCRHDMPAGPAATARGCLKGQTSYYLAKAGSQTGVCQNVDCPFWSGRDGRKFDAAAGQDPAFQTYREYKLVCPPELRTVAEPALAYYADCGSVYDRYRADDGGSTYVGDRGDASNTWATSCEPASPISYVFTGADAAGIYEVVVEVPPAALDMEVRINGSTRLIVSEAPAAPKRYRLDVPGKRTRIAVDFAPRTPGSLASVAQIWVVGSVPAPHRNHGVQLRLPTVLDNLSAGTEIPANFVQLFDAAENVNRTLDNVRVYATRFDPASTRDAFDVVLYGDQRLEVGNGRYLAVTAGAPVASVLGALLEAFLVHAADHSIHLDRSTICGLLADRSACCDGSLRVELDHLYPETRVLNGPGDYVIGAKVYHGYPPYTVTVDWGDGSSAAASGDIPSVVSGVQVWTFAEDMTAAREFDHYYASGGKYKVQFGVTDNPEKFGCSATLAGVSPLRVGSLPTIDPEVRLDYASAYPYGVFRALISGYVFAETPSGAWTDSPTWHVLTQIHSTDPEDGRAGSYWWKLDNPNGKTFGVQYEDVAAVSGAAMFVSGVVHLPSGLVAQDSLVLSKGETLYQQGTDYTVDHVSGVVYSVPGRIPDAAGYSVRYFRYPHASGALQVSGQWVDLGESNAATIDLSAFTSRTDLPTIRFKIRE